MIYFDEADNSGDNLLDQIQPVYLLLSHDFTEAEAREILKPLASVSGAAELHFKNVKKHYKQQQALLQCFQHPLISTDRVFAFAAHKEFMITIQIVDKLIEHVLHKQGIDIYKDGTNISTANMIYMLGTKFWDRQLFDSMCQKFVQWNRTIQKEDGQAFYDAALHLHQSIKEDNEKAFTGLILQSAIYLLKIQASFQKYSIDATLSCFAVHCHHWSKKNQGALDITCDNSHQMTYWEGMIQFLTTLPDEEVGFGSRKHNAAIKVKNVSQMDSKDSIQLQLADLLASAINYYFISVVKKSDDKFPDKIIESLEGKVMLNKMWPGLEITPEELDMTDTEGTNPLDFFADHVARNPSAFDKARSKKNQNG